MKSSVKLFVAETFKKWLFSGEVKDPHVLLIGKIILDNLQFIDYSLLNEISEVLEKCKDRKIDDEMINTDSMLALSSACRIHKYDVAARVLHAYINLIHLKKMDESVLTNMLPIIQKQTQGDVQ